MTRNKITVDKPVTNIGIHMVDSSNEFASISFAIVVDPAGLKGAKSDDIVKIWRTAKARKPKRAAVVGVLLMTLTKIPKDV